MFVAPVEVGDGAYTAAGSVIAQNVPPGALGVARGRQRNIEGWVLRRRRGTAAAAAAQAAQQGGASSASGASQGETIHEVRDDGRTGQVPGDTATG
jgi:bifunctional UDP-N-acetylglucosamine pyrophosphorylase/glucosamine-1-phosphate N-acetyltransferase